MAYTPYQEEDYVEEGLNSAALTLHAKAYELSVITTLSALRHISAENLTVEDLELAQKGAHIHGQIDNYELFGQKLEASKAGYVGTNKEAYYSHIIQNNASRLDILKNEFADINGKIDYTTAKSSFNLLFGGVIGVIGGAVNIGYTLVSQIDAIDDKIDSALLNNITPEEAFYDHFAKASEITFTTGASIAAEFILKTGALTLNNFFITAAKATVASIAITLAYKAGAAAGTLAYDFDPFAEFIQNAIEGSVSLFDETTMDRYPEAVATLSVLAKNIDPDFSLSELIEILSRSKNTFKDYGEISSMLDSINKVFGIESTTLITDSDELIDDVVNSIIAIKDAHPNQNFIFLSVSSEDVEDNITSSTESIALAYRFALESLNPFAIIHNPGPNEASIYDQHNLSGELNSDQFSVEYVSARLQLLTDKNLAYSVGQDEYRLYGSTKNADFIDVESGFESHHFTADTNTNPVMQKYIFDTNEDGELIGNSQNDYLFGRGGDDTFQGLSGNDYLEGGKGSDTLNGGSGIDTYHFNSGDSSFSFGGLDTVYDTDQNNLFSFGSGVDLSSLKFIHFGNDLGVYFESGNGSVDTVILDDWYNNQDMISNLSIDNSNESSNNILTLFTGQLEYDQGQLSGTAGKDIIYYDANLFDDTTNYTIVGFQGNDELNGINVSGGSGNDIIKFFDPTGVSGIDGGKLYGGSGEDTIYGGQYGDQIYTYTDGYHANLWTIIQLAAHDLTFNLAEENFAGMPGFDPNSYVPSYLPPDSTMLYWYEKIADLRLGENDTNNVYSGDGYDQIYGGYGNEIYHFNAGELTDSIVDMGGENTLKFDYNFSDVSVVYKYETLYLYQGDTFHSQLEVNQESLDPGYLNAIYLSGNYFTSHLEILNTFKYQFNDGLYDLSDIQDKAFNFIGTESDDIVSMADYHHYANEDIKTITLGGGDDYLTFNGTNGVIDGGAGDDEFHLSINAGVENDLILRSGDGNDTLQHHFGDLNLDIQFEANPQGVEINAEDITIEQNTLTSGNKEWVVRYSDNDSLTIRGASGLAGVSFILPAGLLLTLSDFSETVYAAESGGYVNTGSTVGSTIVSGIGQDTISDNMANNTQYELALGSGQDTLYDMGGQDAIIFGQNIEQSDLVFVREGANLTIEYSENDRVTINDWYTFGDYRVESIQFADGTALNSGDLSLLTDSLSVGDLELVGSQYEDYLMGDTGNDTLTGGEGNDYLSGGEGNDEYRFNLGDGMDTVSDYSGADTFVFGPGILPSDIVFQRVGDNLQVNYSLNDSITIEYWFFGTEYRVESFDFDDGTVWDQAYLSGQTDTLITPGMTVDGTEYDDFLYGSSGDDVLTGGTGNDTLFGGQGNDEYRFGLGDGLDIVSEEGGVDTLVFGPGISASDIVLTRMGDNLEIAYSPNDAILIDYWYASPDLKIEAFMFDDGTVWDQAAITNLTANLAEPDLTVTGSEFDDHLTTGGGNDDVSGLGGQDTIETYAGNDTLNGGTGDDYLIGGLGDDSYFFTIGDGVDFIHDEGGADQIVFGPSITQSDVSFERFGDNLTVHYNASDSFTVSGWYATPEFEIEAFHFNDGSSWNASALEGLTDNLPVQALPGVELIGTEFGDFLTGSEGNDILVGLAGDDFLESYNGDDALTGGAGMDYLIGGAGNDTYLFNVGDGVDFIGDEDGQDAIHFGESISLADLLIESDGNDLFIHYTENDSITVDSHAGIGKVETIHFYDGSFIDSAAIDAMTIQQQVPDAA